MQSCSKLQKVDQSDASRKYSPLNKFTPRNQFPISFPASFPHMLLEILTFATILATTLYFLLPRLLEQKGIFPGPKSHWLTGTPRSSAQTCFQNEEWVQEYGASVL